MSSGNGMVDSGELTDNGCRTSRRAREVRPEDLTAKDWEYAGDRFADDAEYNGDLMLEYATAKSEHEECKCPRCVAGRRIIKAGRKYEADAVDAAKQRLGR